MNVDVLKRKVNATAPFWVRSKYLSGSSAALAGSQINGILAYVSPHHAQHDLSQNSTCSVGEGHRRLLGLM